MRQHFPLTFRDEDQKKAEAGLKGRLNPKSEEITSHQSHHSTGLRREPHNAPGQGGGGP